MKILLAEHYRAVAEATGRALRMAGHTVYTVHDGVQALDSLVSEGFDLIVTEHALPRIDGSTVLRSAVSRGVHCASIGILSTSYYDGDIANAYDVVLTKPFAVQTLLVAAARLDEAHGQEQVGDLVIDMDKRTLRYRDRMVTLTLPELLATRRIAQADAPVSAETITFVPLAATEGSAFKLVAFINRKMRKVGMALSLVPVQDKGYVVSYDC